MYRTIFIQVLEASHHGLLHPYFLHIQDGFTVEPFIHQRIFGILICLAHAAVV